MNNMYDILSKFNSVAGSQQLNEGKKPDFLDLDKDGDKTEPMKKAAKEIDEASYSAKAARAGKDIGKPGKAFAQISKTAGEKYGSKERGEKVAGAVLKKLRTKEEVEEGIGDVVKKVGGIAKKVGGKVLDKLGHGSDEDLIRDLQKKVGVPQTGKKPMAHVNEALADCQQIIDSMPGDIAEFKQSGDLSDSLYNALFDCWADEMPYGTAKARTGDPYQWIADRLEQELGMSEGVDKEKFAALAPPRNKITFADKIAGAKKEVDEMLGDVAAEAMKKAISKMGGDSHQAKTTMKHIPNAGPALKKAAKDIKPGVAGYRDRADMLRAGGVKGAPGEYAKESRDDDDDVYAYQDPSKKKTHKTAAGGTVTSHGGVTRHAAAPGRYGGYDPETDPDKDDDKPEKSGEKRGRGRPKGTGKSIGAKGPSGKSKLLAKESAGHDDIAVLERLMDEAFAEGKTALGNAIQGVLEQLSNKEEIDEKAVSKKQQKFMGMVHAAQKGEKPASKEVAKVAKEMPKKAAKEFAATKHKGLPEKKKPEGKKKEVEETTTAGSVATAPSTGKASGMFGKGVYEAKIAESFDKKLNSVLTESISVNMSGSTEGDKSLTVTATDEHALQLAQILQMAGLGGSAEPTAPCSTCGSTPCGCEEQQMAEGDLANSPEPEYSDTDTMVNTLSGGLNGRKSTGQTTVPVVNRDPARGSVGPVAESAESKLWELYHRYSVK